MKTRCSLYKKLEISCGTYDDYLALAKYHYRGGNVGQISAIYTLRPAAKIFLPVRTVGVIVYSRPVPSLELRKLATDNFFMGFDRSTQLALLNRHVRRISRVIIEPRFRGLGLASRLVRETLPLVNVPIVEALAVMGEVNPFFEKAGMKAFRAPEKESNVRLKEALSSVGIEERLFIDPEAVERIIESLPQDEAEFIEAETRQFLKSYTNHRYDRPSPARTQFVLNKLSSRPVYYIWHNQRKIQKLKIKN
ncbi:MAG: hypothetical protein JW715_13775 [Sedimentisphaerales bacterium]|nr:hypothetical protein [Sedimentisphaerales bacterium]